MTIEDWKRFVRERLTLPDLSAARTTDIVEDVAQQLDEAYREALGLGSSDAEARSAAEEQIPDWPAFAQQLEDTIGLERPAVEERAIDALEARSSPTIRSSR